MDHQVVIHHSEMSESYPENAVALQVRRKLLTRNSKWSRRSWSPKTATNDDTLYRGRTAVTNSDISATRRLILLSNDSHMRKPLPHRERRCNQLIYQTQGTTSGIHCSRANPYEPPMNFLAPQEL